MSQPAFLVCSDASEIITWLQDTKTPKEDTRKRKKLSKQTLTKLGHLRGVIHANELKSNGSVRVYVHLLQQ